MVHYNPLGGPAEWMAESMVRTSSPCRRYIHHVYNCSMRTSDDTWSSINTNESPPFIAGSAVVSPTSGYASLSPSISTGIYRGIGEAQESHGLTIIMAAGRMYACGYRLTR